MAELTEQPVMGNFSDETIRRFLLGRLAAAEATILEKRMFSDADLEEQVRLAELELADDYAFDRLSATEQALCEKVFPVSAARKQQLSASMALRRSSLLAPAPQTAARVESRTPAGAALRRLFGFHQPALGYAIGFALLLILAGIVWFVVKDRRAQQPLIAQHQPTPVATREFAHPTATPAPSSTVSPQPTVRVSPTPEVSATGPLIATLIIAPGALRDRGEMPHVTVPQTAPPNAQGIIRLQLTVADEPGTWVAELLTAEGRSLYVSGKLKMNKSDANPRIAFDVPGRLMKMGDYQVRLSRTISGSTTSAGRYYFRVTD